MQLSKPILFLFMYKQKNVFYNVVYSLLDSVKLFRSVFFSIQFLPLGVQIPT